MDSLGSLTLQFTLCIAGYISLSKLSYGQMDLTELVYKFTLNKEICI